jgi:hypothetical protein
MDNAKAAWSDAHPGPSSDDSDASFVTAFNDEAVSPNNSPRSRTSHISTLLAERHFRRLQDLPYDLLNHCWVYLTDNSCSSNILRANN